MPGKKRLEIPQKVLFSYYINILQKRRDREPLACGLSSKLDGFWPQTKAGLFEPGCLLHNPIVGLQDNLDNSDFSLYLQGYNWPAEE
jgi:hypothetical protein